MTYNFDSYEQSVLDAADDFGLLSPGDARRLVSQNQANWDEWVASKPESAYDAQALLSWLGY